jgi:L-lactate utilization protein LutB
MVTLTLTLDLEESLVQAYQQAKAAEKKALKKKIEQLFALQWRRQEVEAVRQKNIEALIQSMDELGKQAEANGMTEEILDQILAES